MRIVLLTAAIVLAAACSPSPVPAASPSASSPTAEELGQDDPSVPFTPAPVGAATKWDAMSKTAMSLTGDLTLTPTAQTGPNMPPGATFAFSKGLAVTTTTMPGGAEQGAKPYDFKAAFPMLKPGGAIEMYSIDSELPGPDAGKLCENTQFLATYADGDTLSLAAFSSTEWPPENADTALCATYAYSAAK